MVKNYIQILTDSLKKKEKILQKIVELNEVQKNIISSKEFDGDEFQKNIDEKSELVETIISIDNGFQSVFDRIKDEMQGKKDEYSSEISILKDYIKKVTELGATIQAQELRNKDLVEKTFSNMRKEISSARKTTSMANAYYKNANNLNQTESFFLDQKK